LRSANSISLSVFSDAREYATARIAARRHDPKQFALADDVKTGAKAGQDAETACWNSL